MLMIIGIVLCILAYLIGSLNSAIIVCKISGLPSPLNEGSQNPGTTNVLRIGGKGPAIITLVGDILKGFIPVIIGQWAHIPYFGLALIGLFAVIGHILPIFFKFQGGKGVATAIGVFFGVSPIFGLTCIITWAIIAIITRYSSLSALVMIILSPLYAYWMFPSSAWGVFTILAIIVVLCHHANIKRLIQGNESKIGQKKT